MSKWETTRSWALDGLQGVCNSLQASLLNRQGQLCSSSGSWLGFQSCRNVKLKCQSCQVEHYNERTRLLALIHISGQQHRHERVGANAGGIPTYMSNRNPKLDKRKLACGKASLRCLRCGGKSRMTCRWPNPTSSFELWWHTKCMSDTRTVHMIWTTHARLPHSVADLCT